MYELYVNKTFDDGIHAYYVNVKKNKAAHGKSRQALSYGRVQMVTIVLT